MHCEKSSSTVRKSTERSRLSSRSKNSTNPRLHIFSVTPSGEQAHETAERIPLSCQLQNLRRVDRQTRHLAGQARRSGFTGVGRSYHRSPAIHSHHTVLRVSRQ